MSSWLHRLGLGLTLALLGAGAGAELTIDYELPVPPEDVQSMLLGVDGYDATAFASFTTERATLSPETPLEGGDHLITVHAFLHSGELIQLAEKQVRVTTSLAESAEYDLLLATQYRVAEKESSDFTDVDEHGNNASTGLRTERVGRRWRHSAAVNLLYDDHAEAHPDGEELLLPNYRLAFLHDSSPVHMGFVLGHQDLAVTDLLFASFERRGVGLSVADESGLAQLQMMAVHSEVVAGIDEGLVLPGDSDRRSYAVRASLPVVPGNPEWLQLSAGYIDGEGRWSGVGTSLIDEDTTYGGESWNIAGDSWLWDRQLWLHAEYASSRFDSDGFGIGAGKRSDSARQLIVELDGSRQLRLPGLDYWSLTAQHQEVGLDYYSMGYLGLPGDRRLDAIWFSGARGGLTLEAAYSKEHNDVDEDPQRAEQRIERMHVTASYAFGVDPAAGVWRWLGVPAMTAFYSRTAREQDDADALLVAYDLDDLTTEAAVGAEFTQALWSWSLNYRRIWFDDDSQAVVDSGFLLFTPLGDSDTDIVSLQFSWQPNARFFIAPYVQWSERDSKQSGDRYRELLFSVQASMQLIPESLLLNLSYSFDRREDELTDVLAIDSDFRSQVANVDLRWQVLAPRRSRPGFSTFLRGSYGRQRDEVLGFGDEIHQIMLGFDIPWASQESR